jgi:beta-N-acetylhexosaminidase
MSINLKDKPFCLDEKQVKWVKDTLSSMTEEEKIGQLFFLVGYSKEAEFLKRVSGELKVGGLMCRSMMSEEVIDTVSILQQNSKIPMLIAANLEAGGNGIASDGTKVGSQMAIAATGKAENAYALGKVCAKEATAVGANYAFAPVSDIDLNFRNPITNTRTYGDNAETVLAMAKEYMRACDEEGVCISVKHFPGDGVDERDQHLLTSINSLSCAEWDMTYGKIYGGMIDAGAKTVMVGHIMQPAYSRALNPKLKDEEILPASLSSELLGGLLRKKLGFNGLIITDATTMGGFAQAMPRDKAVPGAIAAGCDMFLFTKNLDEDFEFMHRGVRDGVITSKRLDEAVTRILALKASLKLNEKNNVPSKEKAKEVISCPEHKEIAHKIADESITLVKEEAGVFPITPEKYKRILLYDIESGENALGYDRSGGIAEKITKLLEKRGFDVTLFVPSGRYEGLQSSFTDMKTSYDLMLYTCSLATKSNQTTVRIEWMNPMGVNVPIYIKSIPTVFVSLENPYHLLDVPRVRTYINTYGVNEFTLEELVDKMMGLSEFKGKSPIDPFCGKWDAKLKY